MGFWVNFETLPQGKVVYLSDGGHTLESHGVAMLYNQGQLEFRFRRKDGSEWTVTSDDVLPGRWYHIITTWGEREGLSLYINGHFVQRDVSPIIKHPNRITPDYSDFLIGKGNDDTSTGRPDSDRTVLVDEFNFWSMYKSKDEIKELGQYIVCYN